MSTPPRLFVTDCEGPLTRNDNAMEVTAAFVPDGAELFSRLSRYDDFLADVQHKPGYNAGDTLRLIVPFLLAYGVGDRDVEEYSADTVLVVPGARDLLRDVAALDRLFWVEMGAQGRRSADIVATVRPVGGGLKLSALREIAAGRRVALADVMYVGDSITDVPPFTAVREAGGVALSFNGNRYALAAAELAAAAADTAPTRKLALAFAAGGRDAVLAAIGEWPPTTKPLPRVGLLSEAAPALAHASAYARSHVRGERVARLG